MHPVLRNLIAVLIGAIIGSFINMSLVNLGPVVFPIEGFDPSDLESLKAAIHLFEPKNFLFPFLGHALGTLIGALVAAWIAVDRNLFLALIIGAFFLVGGIMMAYMIPGPWWFAALDLVVAYIPMAWLGGKLGIKLKQQ